MGATNSRRASPRHCHSVAMATLEDQADYRAVLAAVNALGVNQRDHSLRLTAVETGVTAVKTDLTDFRIGRRIPR